MFFPVESKHTAHVSRAMDEISEKDISPSNNLGSFVKTSQEASAAKHVAINAQKNQACMGEYPSTAKYRDDCISMLADLWHVQDDENAFGTAATGSSEALMLAGIAMKQYKQDRQHSHGKLNVVVGANCHICVLKFALYFDIEARVVPVSEMSGYAFDPSILEGYLDGLTIGVFLTLGSTYTGHFDPVAHVASRLDEYHTRTGNDIPIHVDAASGGFVAPFSNSNNIPWDFRIPRVRSINTSGHKFGQAPCAVGWVLWRDRSYLPENLILESSYLRGTQTSFTLSFSRSSAPIAGQYYYMHRLGREGYGLLIGRLLSMARELSLKIEDTGYFSCVSSIHRLKTGGDGGFRSGLPVVVFTLSGEFRRRNPTVSLARVSDEMHQRGFAIPHYPLKGWSKTGQDIDVLRIVVREAAMEDTLNQALEELVDVMREST